MNNVLCELLLSRILDNLRDTALTLVDCLNFAKWQEVACKYCSVL